jgi:hypothetical protein
MADSTNKEEEEPKQRCGDNDEKASSSENYDNEDDILILADGINTDANDICRFTKSIPLRKRIYGEEFREINHFVAQPNFYDLKLDQPVFENLNNSGTISLFSASTTASSASVASAAATTTAAAAASTNTTKINICNYEDENTNIVNHNRWIIHPTRTRRAFARYKIDVERIPDVCENCYSLKCVCSF